MGNARGKQTVQNDRSTKEIIEQKAISILSEKGYDAASIREIAEASGVTKPVIYYYFKSKENLCHYLISSGLEEFRHQLEAVCEDGREGTFEHIVRAVQVQFDFCKGNTEFVRFLYALNFGPDRKKINYDFHAYGMDILRIMTGLMRRGSEEGLIRRGKEETAVYYLRGIVNTYVMLYVDGRGELPPDLARTIVTDMMNGLGPSNPDAE